VVPNQLKSLAHEFLGNNRQKKNIVSNIFQRFQHSR
jgi:hypothetical protein